MEKIEEPKNTSGFTVIEIIVTIIIFIIFIGGAFQTYVVLESQRVSLLRQTIASDIAYTNLRKFNTRPPTLTTCSATIDMTAYYNFTQESVPTALGTGVTQTVQGYPVDGCSGTNFVSNVLKVESKVTYAGTSVTRTAYINGTSVTVMTPPTYQASTLYWGPTYNAYANGTGYTSMAMPTHSAGDILLVFLSGYTGYYGGIPSSAAPAAGGTVPVWNEIPGGTNGGRMWWTRATASNHTSGLWYTMEGWIQCIVSISGAVTTGSPIGGATNSSATNVTPAITLTNTDGSSLILTIYRLQNSTGGGPSPTITGPPSGYTLLAGGTWVSPNTMRHAYGIIKKDASTSDGSYVFGTPNFSMSAGTVFQVEVKSR